MMKSDERYLVISDLQIPFEASRALQFCKYVKKHFNILDENCYNVGDEVDQYFGSLYQKSPDASHTPNSEIEDTRQTLRKWYCAFPQMKLAVSNHGMRWAKKASEAGIPSQMVRKYQEVIQAPDGWQWSDEWIVKTKNPFRVFHGLGFSGVTPYRSILYTSTISQVFGHLHSSAGIAYLKTHDKNIWGMNVGCLIDEKAYAFEYNKSDKFRPNLGVGVILNGGKTPIILPYN